MYIAGSTESTAESYLDDAAEYEDFEWKKLMVAKAQVYAILALAEAQRETNEILKSMKEHNFLTFKNP